MVEYQRNKFFRAASTKRDNKFGRLRLKTTKIKRGPIGKTLDAEKYRESCSPPRQCYTAHINSDPKEVTGATSCKLNKDNISTKDSFIVATHNFKFTHRFHGCSIKWT